MLKKLFRLWVWLKRGFFILIAVITLATGALLYYAGDLGKTDLVFKRMWNSFVYLIGASQLKQRDYGNLEIHGLVSVYDGDTFTCNIDGLHPVVGEAIGIRIRGIDTPEMTDKRASIKRKAIQARDYLRRRLVTAKKITLVNVERDKYFRILADVYVNEISISKELIAKGLAKPYDGGTKSQW